MKIKNLSIFLIVFISLFFSVFQAEADNTFRVTTYEITKFNGDRYDLTLNQDLKDDYFVMIRGGASGGVTRNASADFVRVTRDPNGTGDLSVSGASNKIRLKRASAAGNWSGTVTVVESLGDSNQSGFKLLDVKTITVSGTGVQSATATSSSWNDINQVVTFGGIRGGGVTVSGGASNDHCYGHGRIYPSGNNTINITRNSAGCGTTAHDGIYTVYVVEWGSEWNIQHVVVTGNAGGNGINSTTEYNTASINSVNRNNTWIWAAGYTNDGGIGDSWSGQVATLGDGVNQNMTETTVAVGAEYSDNRSVDVFVLEHSDAKVDYRFKSDGNANNLNYNHTVDSKSGETYQNVNVGMLGVLNQSAMDGNDGGWAILYGNNSVGTSFKIAIDEDEIADSERNHTTEQVDYWMFEKGTAGNIRDSAGNIIGEYGIVSSVGTTSTTVNFNNTLNNPVVVTTYNITSSANTPTVTRVNNISNSSFDVYLQAASSSGTPTSGDVYWIALNSGAHTLPGGISVEAGTVNISGVNYKNSWGNSAMTQIAPVNSYTSPIVLGQIETVNDTNWQTFWSSNGNRNSPPSSSAIYIGRHVGGDTNTTRLSETVGYIIIEESTGTTDNVAWKAGRTSDTVQGVDNSPPYLFLIFSVTPSYTIGRFGLQYNSSNGTGTAFPRPYWGVRHTGATTLKAFRQYSGQAWAAWVQSIDLTDISYGFLNVDIVDANGNSVSSPSVTFSSTTFDWDAQQTTGILGVANEKIRINNTTSTPNWSLSISATAGASALWNSGNYTYDYNGTASTGRLEVDPSNSTITPQTGCSNTGISKGLAAYFDSNNNITLVNADGTADTNCYWDITGIDLTQDIPAGQQVDSSPYVINMTLTVS